MKPNYTTARDNLKLLELLRECERVLAMVPADHEPAPGFLYELHAGYVAPLIAKIREQASSSSQNETKR